MNNKEIIVIGSVNIDRTFYVKEKMRPGMTLHAESFFKNVGGKGANQAVASFYLGGNSFFFGCVGNDDDGTYISSFLKEIGLNHHLIKSNNSTGSAYITVDYESGENSILVYKGSNGDLTNKDIDSIEDKFKEGNILLIQLEIPLKTAIYAIKKAKANNMVVILNPAPIAPLPSDLFQYIDYLVPNEHEASYLVNNLSTHEDRAKELLNRGVKTVIITLGKEGCLIANKDGINKIEAIKVNAIDTTAAGDTFLGGLATYLSQGKSVLEAAKFASKAASITVTRKGAIAALPKLEEIE